MSRVREGLIRKLVRELIRQELDEANSTSSVGGSYNTPHAFGGSNKKVKVRARPVTREVMMNQLMELVILLQKTRS